MEYLEDIKDSESMEPEWGERFRSWYMTKVDNRTENFPLGDEISYPLKVCDFQYRFILPARLEFVRGIDEDGKVLYGILSYSEDERLLGVFRFPQESNGFFASPVSFKKTMDDVITLTAEQIKELINRKKVLTFEAFRIPFFGFEYFSMADSDFEEIERLAGQDFTNSLRSTYEKERALKLEEIKTKITALPNYVLILQNILDRRWTDESEITTMTNGIIHFGV